MDQKNLSNVRNALPSTERSLPITLLHARNTVMFPIRKLLAKSGLTEQQWRVLRVLMETGPIDATQLADRACLLAPSLTRIIRTMSAQGYISHNPDPQDRRRQQIKILAKGLRVIEDNREQAVSIAQEHVERLGNDDYEQLIHLLNKLIAK